MAAHRKTADSLTPQEEKFVNEYLIDSNGTQAAIRAGYSEKTASAIQSTLRNKPHVAKAIAKRQKTLADKLGITAERVLRELASIGFSNIQDYTSNETQDGVTLPVVNIADATREQLAAVSEVTTESYYDKYKDERVTTTKLKLYAKREALETLGKHLGLAGFGRTQVELTGPQGGPVQMVTRNLTDAQLEQMIAAQADDVIEGE